MCRSRDATWGISRTARVALRCVVLAFLLPLALTACSASQDRTQRLAARPADTLRAMNAGRSTGPSPTCRKLLRSAQRTFPMRQRALVQRYLVDLRDQGISHSPKDRTASLRRIAAGN